MNMTQKKTKTFNRILTPVMAEANHTNYVPKEIATLPFFFPDITNSQEATRYIKHYGPVSTGCYLLRLSTKGDNYLSLSVSIGESSVQHINVVMEKQGGHFLYYIVPGIKFMSFMKLCSFYKQHSVGNLQKIENVRLLYPINNYSDYERLGGVSKRTMQPDEQMAMILPAISANSLQPSFLAMSPEAKRAHPVRSSSTSSFRKKKRIPLFSHSSEKHMSLDSVTQVKAVASWVPSRTQKTSDIRTNIIEKDHQRKDSVPDSRAPLPPPNCANMDDVYYSTPLDENAPKLEILRRKLKHLERCDCGILLIDAALPDGWTVHRSQEAATKKRLFYQDFNGRTTWNFPPQLLLNITEGQRQTIIRLSEESGFAPPRILFSPECDMILEKLLTKGKKFDNYQSALDTGQQVVPVNKQFLSSNNSEFENSGSTVSETTSPSQQLQNRRQNVDIKDRLSDDNRERLSANMNGRQNAYVKDTLNDNNRESLNANMNGRQNAYVRDGLNDDNRERLNANINGRQNVYVRDRLYDDNRERLNANMNGRKNVDVKDRLNDDNRERLNANLNGRQNVDVKDRLNDDNRDRLNANLNGRENADIKDRPNADSRDRLNADMNGRQIVLINQRQNVDVRDMSIYDVNANTKQNAQGDLSGKSYMYVPTGPVMMYRKRSSDPERQPQQV